MTTPTNSGGFDLDPMRYINSLMSQFQKFGKAIAKVTTKDIPAFGKTLFKDLKSGSLALAANAGFSKLNFPSNVLGKIPFNIFRNGATPNQPPTKKPDPNKEDNTFKMLSRMAIFGSLMGQVMSNLDDYDKVQKRALASNTTLQNIKATSQLGANMSQLMMEIVLLREQGVYELTDSTMSLIARMKMTDQNTAGLRKFLGENSANLLLNTKQAQQLTTSVADYSLKYGERQDAAIDFLNKISENFKLANQAGASPQLLAGLTDLKIQLKGRGDELVSQLQSIITSTDFGTSIALGIQPLVDQALKANDPQQTVQLLKQIAQIGGRQVDALTGGLVDQFGQMGIEMARSQLQAIGGSPELMALPRLAKALEEIQGPMGKTQDYMNSLSGFMQEIAKPMQELTLALANVIYSLGPLAKPLARFLGGFLIGGALMAAIGAIGTVLTLLGGPLVAMVAGVGLIGGIIASTMGSVDKNIKELNDKTEDKRYKLQEQQFDSGLLKYINSSLYNIMSDTDRSNKILEVNTQLLKEQQLVRLALTTAMAKPEKPLVVTR